METVDQVVGARPQSLAATEFDWCDGDMHVVDEIGIEEFPNRGDTDMPSTASSAVIHRADHLRSRRNCSIRTRMSAAVVMG